MGRAAVRVAQSIYDIVVLQLDMYFAGCIGGIDEDAGTEGMEVATERGKDIILVSGSIARSFIVFCTRECPSGMVVGIRCLQGSNRLSGEVGVPFYRLLTDDEASMTGFCRGLRFEDDIALVGVEMTVCVQLAPLWKLAAADAEGQSEGVVT